MYERVSSGLGPRPASIPHEELRERQRAFTSQLDESTVAIITNNPVGVRTADVHHRHRANSYLLYLTGWTEEGGVAVFHHADGDWKCRLYVQPRDVLKETWEGRRPGIEGALEWPVDEAESLAALESDLSELLKHADSVHHVTGLDADVDEIVDKSLNEQSRARQRFGSGPDARFDYRPILNEMRLIKSSSEIALMSHAADLASLAHVEAMQHASVDVGEWQLQAIIEGCFLYHESHWSYPSIVGGGDNATILHYGENSDRIKDGDLVLIDAGCEVGGYASDITRTFPVNGTFTDAQRELYELVLKAEEAGIAASVVGAPYDAPHKVVCDILQNGLESLGIISKELEQDEKFKRMREFFMHGTGHWLGLDVHDVGVYFPEGEDEPARRLEAGMVMTIEPGLYFGAWREDIDIPSRYAGIGIRIEDDVLITEEGPVVLTASCPKSIEEIEALIGSN
jgi:Xaa-Pro aminopeptidase